MQLPAQEAVAFADAVVDSPDSDSRFQAQAKSGRGSIDGRCSGLNICRTFVEDSARIGKQKDS